MLKQRLLTALLLGSLFLGALFYLPSLAWALFLLVFIAIGAMEWGGLAGYSRTGRSIFVGLIVASALLLLAAPQPEPLRMISLTLLATSCLFWLLLAPFWLWRHWPVGAPWRSSLTGAVLLLPPWLALVQLHKTSTGAVLAAMAAVWLADSAAYFFGKRYGRNKLAPAISPGKTWEGVAGAVATVALATTALCYWLGWNLWLVAGSVVIVMMSVVGDLFESLVKRQAGKKDSGNLLPGHGGVLDRIDGLTSTLPLVALATYFPQYFLLQPN